MEREASELVFIRNFKSHILDNERDVVIYLPPGYKKNHDRKYPVLYMQDGQNLFTSIKDGSSSKWEVKETVDKLITEGKIEDIIIAGIYNNEDRISEYTSTYMDKFSAGGGGENYARFIVEELKPFIDKSYRTLSCRENTGLAGASLGGLISFYIGWNYDKVFKKVAAMSPSFWWDNCNIIKELKKYTGLKKDLQIWIDAGDAEETSDRNNNGVIDMVDDARDMVSLLSHMGFMEQKDLAYYEAVAGIHHESAWASRFDKVLLYMFGKGKC